MIKDASSCGCFRRRSMSTNRLEQSGNFCVIESRWQYILATRPEGSRLRAFAFVVRP